MSDLISRLEEHADAFERGVGVMSIADDLRRAARALAEAEAALEKIAEPFGDFAEREAAARKASLWRSMAIEQSDIARQALSTIRAAGGGE